MKRTAQNPRSCPSVKQLSAHTRGGSRWWNPCAALSALTGGTRGNALAVEALESRAMLANSPLPTMSMLQDSNHPVVRFETAYGDIDIELFSGTNPITVANFINYVTSGRYDETFFHRKTTNAQDGIAVLQGGGFLYDNGEGARVMDTDSPINLEIGSGRSNVERTISMARTSNPNSGTNQFFFNMTDNLDLDPQTGSEGYAVFGRVIQGWDAALQMWNFPATDLNDDTAFAGTDIEGAVGSAPTTPEYNSTAGVRENGLAEIINAEVIKPQGFAGTYSFRSVMPEGFNSATATEFVELFNPNSFPVRYQLIAKYEADGDSVNFVAGDREEVIASGSLNGGTTIRVNVSQFGTSDSELTLADRGYALVLETAAPEVETDAQPIAAAMVRSDFGGEETSESFFSRQGYTDGQLRDWAFARLERNETSLEYVLVYNLSDQTATVNIDVLTPDGLVTIPRVIEGYRRSGLALGQGSFAEGILSVRVRSDRPVAAVASDWTVGSFGSGVLFAGAPGAGSTDGAMAGLMNGAGRNSTISVYNPTSTATVITFSGYRNTSTLPIESQQVVLPGTRSDFSLSSLVGGLTDGERVTMMYDSGSVPVVVQYVHDGGGADGGAATFTRGMGEVTHFAQGRVSSASNIALAAEVISIFNPYSTTSDTLEWTVVYNFSDGTSITGASGILDAHERVDVVTLIDDATGDLTDAAVPASDAVRTKLLALNPGTGTRGNYSISVISTLRHTPSSGPEVTVPVSGVVQLTRYMLDPTNSVIVDLGFTHGLTVLLPAVIT